MSRESFPGRSSPVGSDVSVSRRLVLAVTSHLTVNLLLLPQLARLRDAGWEVHVVCSPGPVAPEVRRLAHEVHEVPMSRSISPARDLASTAAMVRLLRRVRPTVIVGSTPKAGMISLMAARLAGVPVRIFQIRGARWDSETGVRATLMKLADRAAARAATDTLAVSRSLAELLVAERITRRPPTVLGHGGSKGVDTTVFLPDRDRSYDPDTPLVGFAGRLSIDKGIGELIDVVSTLRQSIPGLRVQIAGDVDEAQPISEEIAGRLREDPAFDWIGPLTQAELAVRMRGWDLLVFPSHREGLPNVVIEAAASGVPAVAWDVTGVRDAIHDPETGRLVPLGRVEQMAVAARQCLDADRHDLMSTRAVEWARANFDARVLQDLFVSFLDDACRRSDGRGHRA